MKETTPKPIRLKDYKPTTHLIPAVDLTFDLHDERTIVTSRLQFEKNPNSNADQGPLVLNGSHLELLDIKMDGAVLPSTAYTVDHSSLTLHHPLESFTLEITTRINPKANTELEGLYKSGDLFCTQNEPEGFRRITYFLDRSDIMSKYSCKILADKETYPILLSNGNEVNSGILPGGRHWVEWEDPFPKPSYLFALVAGDLGCMRDRHVTPSGRDIDLRIYCDKGNEARCEHAMRSLIKSMIWDEQTFGLEYDLNTFMIVAVDAFNFGAMENKGLNIFNSQYVLADPAIATDSDYLLIEGIVAHEYFHNWTGNRITCRDWFQLTLKEGLTVFRDQEFSADMNSRPVKRINDVIRLRSVQFAEDASPTAHPIKPKSYIQINNFYTPTIYEKGAEVIRMIQTLIGKENFRKGIDKYFELFDGQAVTTEDFLRAMQEASGKDLSQFAHWYDKTGTPQLTFSWSYEADTRTFTLHVTQNQTPALHIPLSIGFLTPAGEEILATTLEFTQPAETFTFPNMEHPPIPSINRSFLAPINAHTQYTRDDLMFLMGHDKDPFNRWEAGQELASQILMDATAALKNNQAPELPLGYLKAFEQILLDPKLDPAFRALALTLPTEETLGQRQDIIDFDHNFQAREWLKTELSTHFKDQWNRLYKELTTDKPYEITADAMGRRRLRNLSLAYLMQNATPETLTLCMRQFQLGTNMTDVSVALNLIADTETPEREHALDAFFQKWRHQPLALAKWLSAQGQSKLPGTTLRVRALTTNPLFDPKIPNHVKHLFRPYLGNHHFHANDGSGYQLIADMVEFIDPINAQTGSMLAGGFKKYNKLDPERKAHMHAQLSRLLALPNLSINVYEIVSKCLG